MKKTLAFLIATVTFAGCISMTPIEEVERMHAFRSELVSVLEIDNHNERNLSLYGSWKAFHFSRTVLMNIYNAKDLDDIERINGIIKTLKGKYKLKRIHVSYYSKDRKGRVVPEELIKKYKIK